MTLQKHVFGNFKRPIVERLKEKARDDHDDREGNDSHHLAALRKCPCVVTLKMPAGEAHHLKALLAHERGIGRKATDRWALPLSRRPHDELENIGSRHELKWFVAQGIADPHALCAALWTHRPKDGSAKAIQMATIAMTKVILAAHSKPSGV